jgi:hypothetical protein
MMSSRFDVLVFNLASQHGLALYIVFLILAQIPAFLAGGRIGRRRSAISDIPTLVCLLLSNVLSFFAFAALTGKFPVQLWFATFSISIAGWLVQWLLAWTASKSEVEFDIEKVSRQTRIVQAIVIAKSPTWAAFAAFALIFSVLVQFGLMVYCGFLFDPQQMGQITYNAEIATFLLVLPSALVGIGMLAQLMAPLISKYTTPAARNIFLSAAVGNVTNSLVLIFGPIYFYRDGFSGLASVIPSLGGLGVTVTGVFAALLIVPYALGSLTNLRFMTNLQASLVLFINRAEELSKRPPGKVRADEERALETRIIEALRPLTRNPLLFNFALKLLESFVQYPGTDAARQQRVVLLQKLGFGTAPPFEGDPVGEMAAIRANIRQQPFYRFIPQVQEFFKLVENDIEAVAEAHPLLLNFQKLTTVLRALVDEIPDSERGYIFADQRPSKSERSRVWRWIKQTLPGWVMGLVTTFFVSPLSEALRPRITAVFDTLLGLVFGGP